MTISNLIDKYKKYLDNDYYAERLIYREVIQDLQALQSSEVDVEKQTELKHHKIKCPQCGMRLKHFYFG